MRLVSSLVNYLWMFCLLFLGQGLQAQNDDNPPKGDLSTPYDAIQTHLYYLRYETYEPIKAAKAIPLRDIRQAQQAAIKLKQIYDGKGLRMPWGSIPEDADFIDSTTKRRVFSPFPERLPEIYLQRDRNGQWRYAKETVQAIERLHKQIYPWGSDFIINLWPEFGQKVILGLAIWQYVTVFLMGLLAFVVFSLSWRLLRLLIGLLARINLGNININQEIIGKIAKLSSYMLVTWLLYVFSPILQFSAEFSYYLLAGLRIANTIFFMYILLNTSELVRDYLIDLTQRTEHKSDDQLVPLGVRVLKVFIVIGGVIHILSLLDVNITALLAGLSIGGLAIALAAQETVKNLFGSAMIYADRPFQIGDLITVDGVTGVVEDVGFRSTRMRTLDSSLVTIPNGQLVNVTVNNLGARPRRRFYTTITVAYHTPLDLLTLYIQGLREIGMRHPKVIKDLGVHVRLHTMEASALSIVFIVNFDTREYHEEIQYREELLFEFIYLAQMLDVQFAYNSTSVYIETLPGQKDNLPDYQARRGTVSERFQGYMNRLDELYPVPPAEGEEGSTSEGEEGQESEDTSAKGKKDV